MATFSQTPVRERELISSTHFIFFSAKRLFTKAPQSSLLTRQRDEAGYPSCRSLQLLELELGLLSDQSVSEYD